MPAVLPPSGHIPWQCSPRRQSPGNQGRGKCVFPSCLYARPRRKGRGYPHTNGLFWNLHTQPLPSRPSAQTMKFSRQQVPSGAASQNAFAGQVLQALAKKCIQISSRSREVNPIVLPYFRVSITSVTDGNLFRYVLTGRCQHSRRCLQLPHRQQFSLFHVFSSFRSARLTSYQMPDLILCPSTRTTAI